jgi:hypothetical protein
MTTPGRSDGLAANWYSAPWHRRSVHEGGHGPHRLPGRPGTPSLLCAGLAQGRKRGGRNWLLTSPLLRPLATFLIAVPSTAPAQ